METKGLINDMDGNVLFYFVFNQAGIVSDTATPVLQLKNNRVYDVYIHFKQIKLSVSHKDLRQ